MLVIDEKGSKIGIMLTKDAVRLAEERGLDLVEVGGSADPPVTKIMDLGKFLYQKHKQEKESRKKSSGQKSIKEMKFGVKTEQHDLQTKIRHIIEFMETGHKTKVIVMYRGREMAHPELGRELLARLLEQLSDYGAPEYAAKQEGRNLVTILAPHSKQTLEKIRRQKEAEAKSRQAAEPTQAPQPAAAASAPPSAAKEGDKIG